ncbi:MAG: hypothetical protein HQK77_18510 [Desulfobacterales bacterium]|nr:hypothetical protein [Desulfobacterales bacterium]
MKTWDDFKHVYHMIYEDRYARYLMKVLFHFMGRFSYIYEEVNDSFLSYLASTFFSYLSNHYAKNIHEKVIVSPDQITSWCQNEGYSLSFEYDRRFQELSDLIGLQKPFESFKKIDPFFSFNTNNNIIIKAREAAFNFCAEKNIENHAALIDYSTDAIIRKILGWLNFLRCYGESQLWHLYEMEKSAYISQAMEKFFFTWKTMQKFVTFDVEKNITKYSIKTISSLEELKQSYLNYIKNKLKSINLAIRWLAEFSDRSFTSKKPIQSLTCFRRSKLTLEELKMLLCGYSDEYYKRLYDAINLIEFPLQPISVSVEEITSSEIEAKKKFYAITLEKNAIDFSKSGLHPILGIEKEASKEKIPYIKELLYFLIDGCFTHKYYFSQKLDFEERMFMQQLENRIDIINIGIESLLYKTSPFLAEKILKAFLTYEQRVKMSNCPAEDI